MKNILITGCSSGIGREAALYFAKEGFTVYASVPRLTDFDREMSDSEHVFPVEIDFLRPETIDRAHEAIAPMLGGDGLHGMINKVVMINPGSTKTNVWRFLETDTERFFATASAEALSRYGDGFKRFRDTFMGFEKSSVHPMCVVKAMERALLARNPRIHYYPSLDTKVYNLLRFVPDKIRDWITYRIIGLQKLTEGRPVKGPA